MTNEAAERLRDTLTEDGWGTGSVAMNLIDDALAAERRATVERIRTALRPEFVVDDISDESLWYYDKDKTDAILDAEADR
jgi:hypothetical protein